MVTPVTKTVGWTPSSDYNNINDLLGYHYTDLVAADEVWTVNVQGGPQSGNLTVGCAGGAGQWKMDATRYLELIGPSFTNCNFSDWEDPLAKCAIGLHASGGHAISVSGDADCNIKFKNFMLFGSSNIGPTTTLTNSAGTVTFENCIFYQQGLYGTPVTLSGAGTHNFINCIFLGAYDNINTRAIILTNTGAASKFYHCMFFSLGTIAVDANAKAATFKNCYAASVGGEAWHDMGAATMVTCGSYDATGSVGLQNILYNMSNYNSGSWGMVNDPEPLPANACYNGGTDLSGEGAPFNVPTDITGEAFVTATPSVGCRQYSVKDPRVRHLIMGDGTTSQNDTSDFADMAALSAANPDLVTAKERWFVELGYQASDATAATFNGWVTNSTYYLHVRQQAYGVQRLVNTARSRTAAPNYAYNWSKNTTATPLTCGNIGASGLVILEGISLLHNPGAGGPNPTILNDASGIGGTFQFRDCRFTGSGGGNSYVLSDPGTGGSKLWFTNCFFNKYTDCIDWNGNAELRMHHCSFLSTAAPGGTKTVCDFHGSPNVHLKNCHAYIRQWIATSYCYKNTAGIGSFTKCSSSDATGSEVSLQNVAYDTTNFQEDNQDYFLPASAGALASAGADLSGETAPLNCPYDNVYSLRKSGSPTIGALESPGGSYPDYSGLWTFINADFAAAGNARAITGVISYSVDGKLYATTYGKTLTKPEIWSSADGGVTWSLEYTGANNNYWIYPGCELGGSLFFIYGPVNKVIKYTNGVGWSAGTDYLNGHASFPQYSQGIFTDGTLLYSIGNNNTGVLYYSTFANAIAGAWTKISTADAGTQYATDASYFGGTTDAGDLWMLTYSGAFMWRGPAASKFTILNFYQLIGSTASAVYGSYTDKAARKVYLIVGSQVQGVPSGYYCPIVIDLAAETLTMGYISAILGASAIPTSIYKIGTNMWWGSVYYSTSPIGTQFCISGSDKFGVQGSMPTALVNVGVANGSYPVASRPNNSSWAYQNGRVIIACGEGSAQYGGVLRSPLLINATKIDDASLRDGTWNAQKFSFSALMKAEAADEPYVRLGVTPGSGTDMDREVRKTESYFMSPKSGGWTQVHGCVDSTAAEREAKEDLANFYPKVFKHGQRVRFQAPCVISGTRVPIAYVDPLTPKAAERVSYSNVAFMNNFVMKLRWNPIHTAQVLDSDVDLFTIGTGADYIRVVQRGSTYGGLSQQREYSSGARYGIHDPIFTIRKVVGGVTALSHNLILYPSYPGENEAADVFGNDTWEFEVVHVQGTVYGIRVKSAGLVGEWWAPSTGLGAFAANPIGSLTIAGYGYFGAPEIRGQLDDEFTNRLGPARKLPATRSDVVRRMGFADHINPVFAGDRDPTEGVLTLDNPFLFTEDFLRADSGSLGGKWSTLTRTGAGWYISSSMAKCSGTGMEIWTPAPRHADYEVIGRVGLNTTGNYAGIIGRHEPSETSLMGYSVELEQTGAGSANMNICRWFKGVRTILSTTALSSYTAGNDYMLALSMTGTNLMAFVMDYPLIAVVAMDSTTDTFFTKPGVSGLYGVSGGPAEVISAGAFTLFRNFDYSID